MANKTGIVRAGRTVDLGEIDKDKRLVRTNYGPGERVTVDEAEYDRLFKAGVLAKPNSEEARAAAIAADSIPSNFPGRDALKKAGITTFSGLAEVKDKTEIEGVGEKTAEAMDEALKAREE